MIYKHKVPVDTDRFVRRFLILMLLLPTGCLDHISDTSGSLLLTFLNVTFKHVLKSMLSKSTNENNKLLLFSRSKHPTVIKKLIKTLYNWKLPLKLCLQKNNSLDA